MPWYCVESATARYGELCSTLVFVYQGEEQFIPTLAATAGLGGSMKDWVVKPWS